MEKEQRRWLKKLGIKRASLRCRECGNRFDGLVYGPEAWNHDSYCQTCRKHMNEIAMEEHSVQIGYAL